MKHLLLAAILTSSLAITGCKTESAAVKVAVTYATMKYIDQGGPDQSVNRAARVAAVANQALNAIEGDGFVLSEFTAHLVRNLPADLSPSDRTLAVALIGLIGDEISARIVDGNLTPEKRVQVKKVLGWVVEATAYYERTAGTLVHKRKIWRV